MSCFYCGKEDRVAVRKRGDGTLQVCHSCEGVVQRSCRHPRWENGCCYECGALPGAGKRFGRWAGRVFGRIMENFMVYTIPAILSVGVILVILWIILKKIGIEI